MNKQAVGWIVSELVGLWEGPEGRKEGAREGPLGAMDGRSSGKNRWALRWNLWRLVSGIEHGSSIEGKPAQVGHWPRCII